MTDHTELQDVKKENQKTRTENLSEKPQKPSKASSGTRTFLNGLLCGILVMLLVSDVILPLATGSGSAFSLLRLGRSSDSAINRTSINKLENLEEAIDDYYYDTDEVTQEQKEDGLYKGLLDSLDDPYSVYYTADEVKALQESLSGQYYGIGAYISQDKTTGYPMISGVMEGAPAQEAGLQAGDIVYKVDGEDVGDETLDEVVSKVRGEEGTTVTLTIVREGEDDYLEIEVERGQVDAPTVSGRMLDEEKGIGYIAISEFDEVTTSQFEEELGKLQAGEAGDQAASSSEESKEETKSDTGTGTADTSVSIAPSGNASALKGLVLDLRGNPGGNVDTVTAIANYFLPEGLVFYMEDRDGNRTEYTADGTQQLKIPIAVLVNGNSASASEILSGAIKDAGTGTLIGTTTYGKGVVQTVYSLTDGTAIKLTIAKYFTRNGNDINKKGIEPDIELSFDSDAYQKDGTDNQLERAQAEVEKQLE